MDSLEWDYDYLVGTPEELEEMKREQERQLIEITSPDEDFEVDVYAYSFKDFMEVMAARAFDNAHPDGLYEVPAHLMVSPVKDKDAGVHVEVKRMPDAKEDPITDNVKSIAPNSFRERLPGSSEPAFKSVFEEVPFAGTLSKALDCYGKVVRICLEYGISYDSYDAFFRDKWGLGQTVDLNVFVNKSRSSGMSVLAGVGRNTEPVMIAKRAQMPRLKFNYKTITNSDLGENLLVDWPRLSEVFRYMAMDILLNDEMAMKRVDSWKMIANADAMPNKPTFRGLPEYKSGDRAINKDFDGRLRVLVNKIGDMSVTKRSYTERVIIEEVKLGDIANPFPTAQGALKTEKIRFLDPRFISEGLAIKTSTKQLKAKKDKFILITDLLTHIAHYNMVRNPKRYVSMERIRLAKQHYLDTGSPIHYADLVKTVYGNTWPDDFLLRARIFDAVRLGRWVRILCDHLKVKEVMATSQGMELLKRRTAANYSSLKMLVQHIQEASYNVDLEMHGKYMLPKELVAVLTSPLDLPAQIGKVVELHAKHWKYRLLNKEVDAFESTVRLQVRATICGEYKLVIGNEITVSRKGVCQSMAGIVSRRLRRLKMDIALPNWQGWPEDIRYLSENFDAFMRLYDDRWINFMEFRDKIESDLKGFETDFQGILKAVFYDEKYDFGESYADETMVRLKSDYLEVQESKRVERLVEEVKMVKKEVKEDLLDDLLGDIMGVDPTEQKIDEKYNLVEEIVSKGYARSNTRVVLLAEKYGNWVSFEDLNRALKELGHEFDVNDDF